MGANIALRARAAGHFLQMTDQKTTAGSDCRVRGLPETLDLHQFQEQAHWRSCESFIVVEAHHGEIALYNSHHRRFLRLQANESANGGGGQRNRDGLPLGRDQSSAERFILVPAADGAWSLYHPHTRRFLRMEHDLKVNGGGGQVATKNDLPADWAHELWDVLCSPLPVTVDCPYLRQEPNSCTATSLAMLLTWAGVCDHQAVLKSWKDMGGRTDALCAGDAQFIWKFCDARGIRYEHGAGSIQKLKNFIDQGVPVYVLSQAWIGDPLGHARVAVGYDEAKSALIFHCPGSGGPRTRIRFEICEALWGGFRWCNDERRLFFVIKK